MRQVQNLIKKDILNSFIMRIPYYWKTKKERKKLLWIPFFMLIFGVYIYLGIKYVIDWIEVYDKAGIGPAYLNQAVFAFTMLSIMSVIPMIISNFYYSNDVSMLLPLPIKRSDILLSKIIYSIIIMLPTSLFLVVPFFIRYGTYYGHSPLFYISFIIGFLAHALIVVSILTLIVVLMMSVINQFPKSKNILQLLGTVLIMGVSFAISYSVNSSVNGMSTNVIANIGAKMDNIVKYIPSIKLLELASHGNVLALIGLVIIALGLAFIVSRFASAFMVKGVLVNHMVEKRKKLDKDQISKEFKPKSVLARLINKEVMEILKTPVYLTNTLLMGLVIPLAFAVPLYAQRNEIMKGAKDIRAAIDHFTSLMSFEFKFGVLVLAFTAIMIFMSSSATNTAGTSITREGKYLWQMQVAPLKPNTIVLSKVIGAIIIFLISIIPITAIIMYLVKPPLYFVGAYALAVIAAAIFSSNVGMLLDIIKPKLDWQTPQQAMKQNFNAVILTYFTMIVAGLIGFLTYKLIVSQMSEQKLMVVAIMVPVALMILGVIIYGIACKLLKKKLPTY